MNFMEFPHWWAIFRNRNWRCLNGPHGSPINGDTADTPRAFVAESLTWSMMRHSWPFSCHGMARRQKYWPPKCQGFQAGDPHMSSNSSNVKQLLTPFASTSTAENARSVWSPSESHRPGGFQPASATSTDMSLMMASVIRMRQPYCLVTACNKTHNMLVTVGNQGQCCPSRFHNEDGYFNTTSCDIVCTRMWGW